MSAKKKPSLLKKSYKSLLLSFFYCFLIIFASIGVIYLIPQIVSSSEKILADPQIPSNNSKVEGIEHYQIPPKSLGLPAPFLTARAVLVEDLGTGTVLFENNARNSVPIASTTKIMTALVGVEHYSPNTPLKVSLGASAPGSRVGLFKDETLSFRSLLYGMLLNSGNDAAFTIAENYPGGVAGFVAAMNLKAGQLNLQNTHFDNPAGFDSINHYSSALDLSIITKEALKSTELAKIFATKETEVLSLDKTHRHKLANLNKLLSTVTGVLGVKTGYTDAAKENLVALVDRGGHQVLTVVLGSDDRFGETQSLIEWAYKNYIWP